jgi:hypothetical protein
MRWFRANRAFGGRLALFALVLQFCLAFGHIHPEDIYGPAEVTLAAGDLIALPPIEAARSIPADQPWSTADALCQICLSVSLLAVSFVPDAPRLPLPPAFRSTEQARYIGDIFVAARRSPVQPRAPPLA